MGLIDQLQATPEGKRSHGNSDDDLITVCANCHRASCWQGVFVCDEAQTAGTVQKTRRELDALKLEHPDYWK